MNARFRGLAALPWLFAAAVVMVGLTSRSDVLLRAPVDLVRLLAALGCVAAASAFERGERLRVAWLLQAACAVTFLLRDVLLAVHPQVSVWWVLNPLVLLGNACAVVGTWLLARTWRVARIELPGSASQRGVVRVIAIGLALALAGGSLLVDVKHALSGDPQAVVDLLARVSDGVELALVAPMLLTTVALMGGLLFWPWLLLTASLASWLCYDAAATLGDVMQLAPQLRVPREVFRALAVGYLAAAGFAQRWAVRGIAEPVD